MLTQKWLLVSMFLACSLFAPAQKLYNHTISSGLMTGKSDNVILTSSIGESAPVSSLSNGINKLTQGYIQYYNKTTSYIKDNHDKVLVSLYPNPAERVIYLSLGNSYQSEIEIMITNLQGQTLFHQSYHKQEYLQPIAFDIEGYAHGEYLIHLNSKEYPSLNRILKFIKTKQ